jgi:hypothetical protein
MINAKILKQKGAQSEPLLTFSYCPYKPNVSFLLESRPNTV